MRRTIKLLDGSLSYPIEKRGFNLNSKLWTAETLINNPQVIEDTHIDYLKSGVDYITTSSYQLSVRRLREEGYNISEIKRIFNQSVLLAKNALLKTKKKKNQYCRKLWAVCIISFRWIRVHWNLQKWR